MTRLHWSSQLLPANAASSSSHTLASFFFPLCSRRDGGILCGDRTLTYHVADHHHHRSPFLESRLLPRNRSSEFPKGRGRRTKEQNIRRACSASLETFTGDDDEEDEEVFVMRLQELAFQLERQEEDDGMESRIHSESRRNLEAESSCGASPSYDDALFSSSCYSVSSSSLPSSSEPSAKPPWLSGWLEPPDWPASVERNANSVNLPLSLRIIKRKKQQRWVEGSLFGEAACCSVKKAFSSMVFIVRELHSFALQMQQTLFCEDIQGILARVQQEIHGSFVWLFQRIFSCTPTLMVSLMLLLANYTVYSLGHYAAIAAPPHRSAVVVTHHQPESKNQPRFDHSSIKTFSVTRRTASVGGSGGGGGRKVRPVAGATGDGRSDEFISSSYRSHTMPPDGISTVPATGGGEEEGSSTVMEEAAARTWSKIVEEASRMQASSRDGALMDLDTLNRLVSPVTVELEPEDRSDHLRTELNYQQFLAQEPDNPLLLSNFAQFLYLVLHDHDRAEHYFKRAVGTEPVDAEALARYASFLWLARKDLAAAEETYLEAIAADPGNTAHAANYAHFLWSTGGEDTCYPLDADDA